MTEKEYAFKINKEFTDSKLDMKNFGGLIKKLDNNADLQKCNIELLEQELLKYNLYIKKACDISNDKEFFMNEWINGKAYCISDNINDLL